MQLEGLPLEVELARTLLEDATRAGSFRNGTPALEGLQRVEAIVEAAENLAELERTRADRTWPRTVSV